MKPCPKGLHWDNRIKTCNHIGIAKCQSGVGQEVIDGYSFPTRYVHFVLTDWHYYLT